MNAIVKRASNALTNFNPTAVKAAMAKLKRMTQSSRALYLKMDKTGEWSYGIDNEVPEPGAQFLVRPDSFVFGYVAWGVGRNEGQKMGEIMVPATEDVPDPGPVPQGADEWQAQFGVTLVPVAGGPALTFHSGSGGGRDLINALSDVVFARAEDRNCVPVVELDSEFYNSKKYGKIFKPLMPVARWASIPELQAAIDGATQPDVPARKVANGKAPVKAAPTKKAAPPAKKATRR